MPLTTAEARAELATLTAASADELQALFAALTGAMAEEFRDALVDTLPAMGEEYMLMASSLAADWYDDVRDAAEARSSFSAITADLPTLERWDSLARWAVGPLFKPDPNPADALTLVQGGIQRSIANAHRDTIAVSSVADPSAAGWARFGRGDTCDFCSMLIGRGAVYRETTASFESHDHCHCVAAPVFKEVDSINGFLTDGPTDGP